MLLNLNIEFNPSPSASFLYLNPFSTQKPKINYLSAQEQSSSLISMNYLICWTTHISKLRDSIHHRVKSCLPRHSLLPRRLFVHQTTTTHRCGSCKFTALDHSSVAELAPAPFEFSFKYQRLFSDSATVTNDQRCPQLVRLINVIWWCLSALL